MTNPFQPATRHTVPVKVALVGPSGSGKTYTALSIASGIGGRVALIDTEHGSASLYADEFQFDTNLMQPKYSPARFAAGIEAAAQAGYDVLIIDGISPAWNGPGGVMEIVDQSKMGNNQFSGWAKGSPAHQQLVQAILAAPMHLVCTMRSKTAWVLGENNKPQKIGLEPVQRDGIDYEFSVVGELDLQHRLTVTKSRLRGIAVGEVVESPSKDFGALLVHASKGSPQPAAAVTAPEPGLDAGDSGTPAGGSPLFDADEDRRAHDQLSSADLKLDANDRKVISARQVTRLWAIAHNDAKISDSATRNVISAVTGQEHADKIERWQYDRVVQEIQLVGQGSHA